MIGTVSPTGVPPPIEAACEPESRRIADGANRAAGAEAERCGPSRHAQKVSRQRLLDPHPAFAFRIARPEIEARLKIRRSHEQCLAHFGTRHRRVQTRTKAGAVSGKRLIETRRIVQREFRSLERMRWHVASNSDFRVRVQRRRSFQPIAPGQQFIEGQQRRAQSKKPSRNERCGLVGCG